MQIEKNAAKKAKQHTVYKLADGTRVPGTTTITGIMDKPALKKWANELGLKGISLDKYMDELADIGTLAHDGIHAHLTGSPWNTDDASKNQIDAASNAIIKWHYFADKHNIQVLGSEMVLVSEKHRYGGTCDIYAMLDGVPTLIDLKTGKGIFDEMATQLAGYKLLLEESGKPVQRTIIVRIGRNDNEGTEPEVKDFSSVIKLHENRFLLCKELYELNKIIKNS
jgi:hypothetical protein